jgi:hypothetical protein
MSSQISPLLPAGPGPPTSPSQVSQSTRETREKFWLEDPSALFQQLTIIPNCGMTEAERLNAMTRLILVITLILYLLHFGSWLLFLILGLLLVIFLYYINKRSGRIDHYRCYRRRDREQKKKPQPFGGRRYKVSTSSGSSKKIRYHPKNVL